MNSATINLCYLVSAVLFIFGLKNLSNPKTAVRGNILSSLGMMIAVAVTFLNKNIVSYEVIVAGMASGIIIGLLMAYKPSVKSIPQVVAVFNGFGGGASALAVAAVLEGTFGADSERYMDMQISIFSVAAGLIGAVTLTGSGVAFAKLQGLIHGKASLIRGRHFINSILLLISIGFGIWFLFDPEYVLPFWLMLLFSSVLGIMVVLPVGGADMPVIISLLNAFSGLAAAGLGLVINNSVLVIAGSLVGAAGFILTILMCKAMNRSLFNVAFEGVGVSAAQDGESDIYSKVKSTNAQEVAAMLDAYQTIVIVPGYGMAAAQAQYAVKNLSHVLESAGKKVEYAIHPVAGRMPGHMSVLLAEVDIPYENMKEINEINDRFCETDIVLVIGANDIVNPSARDGDPNNPIHGMPILNVDEARSVVVIKRSLSPGFAGIPNPLFSADNCLMLFGDAKKVVMEITHLLEKH